MDEERARRSNRSNLRRNINRLILEELDVWKEELKAEVRRVVKEEIRCAIKEEMKELLAEIRKNEKERTEEEEQRQVDAKREEIRAKERRQEEEQRKANTKREQTNKRVRFNPEWKGEETRKRQEFKKENKGERQEGRKEDDGGKKAASRRKIWFSRKKKQERAEKKREQERQAEQTTKMQQAHASRQNTISTERNVIQKNKTHGNIERDLKSPHVRSDDPLSIQGCFGFDLANVKDKLSKKEVHAPASTEAVAPISVVIPGEDTGLESVDASCFRNLSTPAKIPKNTLDKSISKPDDKVEAPVVDTLDINSILVELILDQMNKLDSGPIIAPEILNIRLEDLREKFLVGVKNFVSVCLAIGYPTVASVSHSIANGFKNLLAIAAVTEVEFFEASSVKEYVKEHSKPGAAVTAPPAAEERKDGKTEEKKGKKEVREGKKEVREGQKEKMEGKKGEEEEEEKLTEAGMYLCSLKNLLP